MSSLRMQIFDRIEEKLELVLVDLDWRTLVRNPREPIGEDQMNAIAFMHGGDSSPENLSGHVEIYWLEFSVGWVVLETKTDMAEALLDLAFVAISDALLDPDDIQLGQLAIGIQREEISDPMIGRSANGSRIVGGQSMSFRVQYMAREGDASSPAP